MNPGPIAVLWTVLAASVQTSPPSPTDGAVRLVCETYCHPTKLGTSCARLRLAVSGAVDEVTGIERSAPATIGRLDVTVFKHGFEKGLYATFPSLGADAARGEVAGRPVPAAALAKRPLLPAFNIRVGAPDARVPFGTDGVTVEGLEPGTLYTWRVSTSAVTNAASLVVSCQAPTCPVDQDRPRNERPGTEP